MFELLSQLFAWCRPAVFIRWCAYLLAFAVLWIILNYPTLQEYFSARENLIKNRREVAHLQKQAKTLDDERNQLLTGGFSVEKAIREDFYMIKPGEKIIFIQPPQIGSKSEPENSGPVNSEPRHTPSNASDR